jgi:septum formation protein
MLKALAFFLTVLFVQPLCITMNSAAVKPATILPILSRINNNIEVILASGSPRRKELITLLGLSRVAVKVSTFAEDLDKSMFANPREYCLATASKKVEEVARSLDGHGEKVLVVGADTIIEIDGIVLEKPADAVQSKKMLSMLRNRDHYVHTAVIAYSNTCFLDEAVPPTPVLQNLFSFIESTKVTFADLTDEDIDAYVALGEGLDKAGSYAIQGTGGQFVQSIQGCYYNVVGLPIHKLSSYLSTSFS